MWKNWYFYIKLFLNVIILKEKIISQCKNTFNNFYIIYLMKSICNQIYKYKLIFLLINI